ncbi:ABC transporter substrate-binding protein [Streptomyces sp. ISL-14]|nr:ABC transporter substrate-binding protein [Streptomyces sp. ISL-14]
MRTAPRRLLSALALSPLLVGCFASGEADSGTNAGAGAGERLRVALAVPPVQALSPYSNDATVLSKLSVAEGLTALDKNGAAAPALAKSWRQVDATTWTFELRKATFQDGTEVTAESVVNALDHADSAEVKPRVLSDVTLTAKADDADTVTLTTKAADPVLPLRLASPALGILSAKAYAKDGTVSPVGTGTGPFEITKLTGKTKAGLDRYDGYWGVKAKAPGIDVKFVPDGTARAAALRSGEADIVEAVPVSQAAVLDQDLITEVPMPRTNTLYLNTEKGAFKDAAVRAAAREAIDAEAIVKGVYEGRADVAEGLLGPALPWAAELRSPVERAKAGAANGKAITIGTYTDRSEMPEVAATLQQQLQKAGFKVKLDVREYTNIEADALAGKFDAFILSRATVLDSGDPAAYLYSDFASNGTFNLSQFADDDVDKALKKASDTKVGDARRKAIIAAEAAVLATDAAVPMLHERVIQGDAAGVVDAAHDPRERELVTVDTYVK